MNNFVQTKLGGEFKFNNNNFFFFGGGGGGGGSCCSPLNVFEDCRNEQ